MTHYWSDVAHKETFLEVRAIVSWTSYPYHTGCPGSMFYPRILSAGIKQLLEENQKAILILALKSLPHRD
jgi:hypothetical protein